MQYDIQDHLNISAFTFLIPHYSFLILKKYGTRKMPDYR